MVKIIISSKIVVKVGNNFYVKDKINFVPLGYKRGVRQGKHITFNEKLYENAKENEKVAIFYGYLKVRGEVKEATIIVANPFYRIEMINEFEEAIGQIKYPIEMIISKEGVYRRGEVNLPKEAYKTCNYFINQLKKTKQAA
jgi:hypothetical protein